MQLVPLLLVAVVMAVDEGLQPIGARWDLSPLSVTALAIGPNVVLLLLAALSVAWRQRQLSRLGVGAPSFYSPLAGTVPGVMVAAERDVRIARVLILLNHAVAVLVFGWVGAVRSLTGDLILVDEVIAILPPLLGMVGTWWMYYPIEQRIRQAILIRRLDQGLHIHRAPSRLGYVVLQARLQLLLLLTPVLVIVAAAEAIDMVADMVAPRSVAWASAIDHVGTLVAAAVVFLFSPHLARLVLDVQPLPAGELREALEEVCRRHRVTVRQLLLWNTHGSMINAAVMGLFGPFRYIMITDALIELLTPDQVRAVMAHEIGHVRRHHMPWLIVCLMAAFLIAAIFIELPLRALYWVDWIESEAIFDGLTIAANVAQLALGLTLFGWICRRFERQADTFAVQHLSGLAESPNAAAGPSGQPGNTVARPITPEAVDSMRGALDAIARLNTVDRRRSSWRHGSIAWRIEYLYSIVGRPVMNLPIDRLIRWIKTAAAMVLIAGLGSSAALQWRNGDFSAQMRPGDDVSCENPVRDEVMEPVAQALIICDAVWKDPATGKSFLLGTFTTVNTGTFPTRLAQMCVYFSVTNCHGRTPLCLRLVYLNVDESQDEELAKAETEVEVPDPLAAVEGAFTIRNVVFPKAGEYRLALESNGVPLLERRLVVTGPRSSTA